MTDISSLPLGTTDPEAFLDNVATLDALIVGTGYRENRVGQQLPTWNEISLRRGFEPPVLYTDGLSILRVTQTVEYGGVIYAIKPSSLPYTTPVSFDAAQWYVLQGLTRAELNAPGGAAEIGIDNQFFGGPSLADALNQIGRLAMTGTVTMMQDTARDWHVYTPTGLPLDISLSITDGLQEAIDFATDNGYNLRVVGAGTSRTADFGLINCADTITFPPLRTMRVVMEGVHITWAPSVTGPGMWLDSLMEVFFQITGELVYQGNSDIVLVEPRNAIPVDTLTTCIDSEIIIGTTACIGGSPLGAIRLKASGGNVLGNFIKFYEINGGGAIGSANIGKYGVVEEAPSSGYGVFNNIIEVAHIHGVTDACLQIGINTTNAQNLSANIYRCGTLQMVGDDGLGGPKGDGINCFGSNYIIDAAVVTPLPGGTVERGVKLQPTANRNIIKLGSIGAITPVDDQGLYNTVTHDGVTYIKGHRQVSPLFGGGYYEISTLGGIVYTMDQFLSGTISRTSQVANVVDITPTAADIVAALGLPAGSFFTVMFQNFNSYTLTVTGGVGITTRGNNVIPAGETRVFKFRILNVGAPDIWMHI